MKSNFLNSGRRFQAKALSLLAGLILCPLAGMAASSIYINTGTINNENLPTIDATNFYNSGTWNISTAAPYKTTHTLNYTNLGSMTGSLGWEFDYGTGSGGRNWSTAFFNEQSRHDRGGRQLRSQPAKLAVFVTGKLFVGIGHEYHQQRHVDCRAPTARSF